MSDTPAQPPFGPAVSPEARAFMTPMLELPASTEKAAALLHHPITRAAARAAAVLRLRPMARARAKRFGVAVRRGRMGGVRVKLVRRHDTVPGDPRLLINFHGGGFAVDAGSLTESIPIAGLTGIAVATVLYRMAPEHPFPAAVDDALAVYRAALRDRAPGAIAIYGTSAGAILTLQLLARIKAEGLPMPAAAGIFSGGGDLSIAGDCEPFLPRMIGSRLSPEVVQDYSRGTDRTDPLLSPTRGELSGLPPCLLMTSTRDQLLSHTVLVDLALRRAGVSVDLRVYEGMFHAFWAWIECPETEVALAAQAEFFARHVAA